ncbi:MAG: OB-fold nucleic acid binding domain-containing protein [Candidatus Bathyarchaeota archaeon]|nr:OB-fold nucleic acid binding domain-containing protein [Candidatus Bathyarchaeota archaeon]
MSTDQIIQQILQKRPEISREQILEALATERDRTGGLIADATLLRLVAAKYGVETSNAKAHSRELPINRLIAGLNDVTVAGRIIAVFPPRTFEGKTSGKYASLMIADASGVLRVMLWNDKVSPVESGALKAGQVARFAHGYTREDRAGKVELHMGSKSSIQIDPEGVNAEDYPCLGRFATKIRDVSETQNGIHLVGRVKAVFSLSTFTRSDDSTGMVLRFTLADDTGEVAVVAWNEKAEELEKTLKVNAVVQLVNARVKAAQNGGFEVHVDSSTFVKIA